MPNAMDRLKLIAEIRKRPALWDLQSEEHKSRLCVPEMWRDVAISMGPNVTVDECKRKWKYLRDAYRAEVKRIEMRVAIDMMKGNYDANYEYDSKWVCYEAMKFIEDIKRPRHSKFSKNMKAHESRDANYDDGHLEDMDIANIEHDLEFNTDDSYTLDHDDDINDLYDSKIKNSAKPGTPEPIDHFKRKSKPTVASNCKCSKLKSEQMHFLQNLEKEEENLIKSTRFDLSRSNDMAHIGDSDYNFLVSFLPQMKTMNDLQNLQFRAKISELMLNIWSTTSRSTNDSSEYSPLDTRSNS